MLLRPDTVALMARNLLPAGLWVEFPPQPAMVGVGFGLGSAVAVSPRSFDPPDVTGEIAWGGLAGTAWWFHPRLQIAGALMTQRLYGQGGLHGVIFKKEGYQALGYR